jgi:hypothetical protein
MLFQLALRRTVPVAHVVCVCGCYVWVVLLATLSSMPDALHFADSSKVGFSQRISPTVLMHGSGLDGC